MSLVMASVVFYVEYALGLSSGQSTFLLAAVLVIAIAGVAVWAWLVRKFSLLPIWRAALAILAVTFIPLYFAPDLTTAIIFSALVGFGFAGVIITMNLIGAMIMDEDTRPALFLLSDRGTTVLSGRRLRPETPSGRHLHRREFDGRVWRVQGRFVAP